MLEQNGAFTIAISPTGQFAYTIENSNDLVSYTLSNGVFKPVGTVYAQVYGLQIGIDPSGSFVYVPQACSNCPGGAYNVVNEFSIGSTGALTKIPGSPVAAGTTPWGIAFTTQ
jgi:DNA-binding beta-propeller fold protein YncE